MVIKLVEKQIIGGKIQAVDGQLLCEGKFFVPPEELAQAILAGRTIAVGELDLPPARATAPKGK